MVWQLTGKSEVSGFESLRTAKVNFDISPGNLCNFSSGFIKIRTWTRRWFCFDSKLLVINIILTIIWQFVKTRKGVGCYSNVWRFCSHKSRSAAEAKHKINIFSDAANGCWNCMLTVSYFLGVFVFWVFGVYLIVVCFFVFNCWTCCLANITKSSPVWRQLAQLWRAAKQIWEGIGDGVILLWRMLL